MSTGVPVPEPFGVAPSEASDVDVLLRLVREQLGMDVAFVTRFDGKYRQFRNIDAVISTGGIVPGYADEREHTFCQYIVDGRIDEVTTDASADDTVRHLPEVEAFGIRAYIGVPLTQGDGTVYGTLCAFSQAADTALGEREMTVLHALAPVLMGVIGREDAERDATAAKSLALTELYEQGGPSSVFQPIVELDGGRTLGWEALSRFAPGSPSPTEWFAAAGAVGGTVLLERKAIRAALEAFDAPDGFLAVNASERTIVSKGFAALFAGLGLDRVMIEITEHYAIEDYPQLQATLAGLRHQGARVAIDDTGAGYSNFQHVLILEPDLIKLDISLIKDIDRDHRRQSLVAAINSFAGQTGSSVVAEGIETPEELACLRGLGVRLGQGYHLARPHPVADLAPAPAAPPPATPRAS